LIGAADDTVMVLLNRSDHRTAEDSDDLCSWLLSLPTPHELTEAVTLTCDRHGDSAPTWMYVEADSAAGVARRRCLACAHSVHALDSEDRWTFPQMWACVRCGHSIAEVAAGLHTVDAAVHWVALGARCVECGRVGGLTDLTVAGRPRDEVLGEL
jgi:hypothetical protein